jgi:hypothetical protein
MKAARRLFAMTNTTPKSMLAIPFQFERSDRYAHCAGFTPDIQQSICHVTLPSEVCRFFSIAVEF